MALYKSQGTKNSSGQDVQEPNTTFYGKATHYNRSLLILCGSVAKRPDHILINNTGSYAFHYTHASSSGTKIIHTNHAIAEFETGSFIMTSGSAAYAPIKVDIQPVAWRRCDVNSSVEGLNTSVTFVYKGK